MGRVVGIPLALRGQAARDRMMKYYTVVKTDISEVSTEEEIFGVVKHGSSERMLDYAVERMVDVLVSQMQDEFPTTSLSKLSTFMMSKLH